MCSPGLQYKVSFPTLLKNHLSTSDTIGNKQKNHNFMQIHFKHKPKRMNKVSKVTRYRRSTVSRKWTPEEIEKVLKYMQANRNLEKPSAHKYYEELLAETKINAGWNKVKCKVRYLKVSLEKAREWKRTNGIALDQGDDVPAIKEKLLQICPHYEQLFDIYGLRSLFDVSPLEDAHEDIEIKPCLRSYINEDTPSTSISGFEDSAHSSDEHEMPMPTAVDDMDMEFKVELEPEVVLPQIMQTNTTNSYVLNKLVEMETERMIFRREKLKLEKEKFHRTIALEERKVEMEEQRVKVEELKIKNEYNLRKMELEQKERILKYEAELKYAKT